MTINSSGIKTCARFWVIFVLIIVVSIEAKRFGGGSRSSGGWGKSSGGWGRGRSGGNRPSPPVRVPPPHPPIVFHPKPPSPPKQPSHFPPPHNSGTSHGKDSSDILIRSEGGGRPRPGGTVNDNRQQSSPHQPSAPHEPITKVNAGTSHSSNPDHGSTNHNVPNPPWANPSMGHPNGGSNTHLPHPSAPFDPSHSNPSKPSGPWTSPPHSPTHPAGPISHQPMTPVHQPNQNSGLPPYNSHPNTPHGMPPPYQQYPPPYQSAPPPYHSIPPPYPGAHPQGMPMPMAPHVGFGNVGHGGINQPMGTPHNLPPMGHPSTQPHAGTVINNHYHAPPVGSVQNPAGHPMYGHQPVYGSAPMGQPFVPGQTVLMLPNQQPQDNGRGVGQILKEAVIYSTVDAGVRRIFNGPTHHHYDSPPPAQSAPAAGAAPAQPSTITNTVIYNNQYGNPADASLQGQNGQSATIPPSPRPGETSNSGGTLPSGTVGAPNLGTSGINSGIPSTTGTQNYSPTNSGSTSQNIGNPGAAHQNTMTNGGSTNSSQAVASNNQTQAAETIPEFQYFISNEELWNLTESLFNKDEINANQYITLNLQTRSVSPNATDEAPGPLLYVRKEVYDLPTIQMMRKIFDNYEFDSEKKENMDSDKRRVENLLLDSLLNTNIMTAAMNWLSGKGYIESDDFEWKDTLRRIWMSKINGATSGFERIFLAEKYPGPSILGAQNWIYYDHQESLKRINYFGYVDQLDLAGKAKLATINFKIDDVVKSNTTMLIGTPPELEMALYTICYYSRPNDLCTVSLGGTKFTIYTHAFRYFGKDLIDLGLMYF